MKIVTVVGARPQFVKAAALSREFDGEDGMEEVLLHTGQHFDSNMSDVFFEEMAIPQPKYHLDIHSLGHGAMTGRMLEGIEEVLEKEKPQLVLVYGDTNSTIAAALAARKLNIRIAHVEAGLRSFDMTMPEEINRILTDRISDFLFCPTDVAVANLHREGFGHFDAAIVKSGDVMQDAVNYYALASGGKSSVIEDNALDRFILCTLHRQENTDDPERLREIVDGLNTIHEGIQVLIPLHPRTRKVLARGDIRLNATVIEPASYFDMMQLLQHCELVMTDSGGLQKEAYFFGKHCVTLRDQTEWTELIDHGVNMLVGASRDRMVEAVSMMSRRKSDFQVDLYGEGQACRRIVKALREQFD